MGPLLCDLGTSKVLSHLTFKGCGFCCHGNLARLNTLVLVNKTYRVPVMCQGLRTPRRTESGLLLARSLELRRPGEAALANNGQRNGQRDLEGRSRSRLSPGDLQEFVKGKVCGGSLVQKQGETLVVKERRRGWGALDILSRQPRLKGSREAGKDGSGSKSTWLGSH